MGSGTISALASARAGRAGAYLVIAVLALLTAGLWGYLIAHVVDYWDGTSSELREDFVAFYSAGRLVRDGLGDTIYQPEVVAQVEEALLGRPAGRHGGLAFMNPPFVAGLFQPFTVLSYGTAQAVWFGVSALVVAASLALLWPDLRKLRRRWALAFALASLASFPVFSSLVYGQLSSLVLLSWVVSYRLSRQGREVPAGLALAASLIKPQLAIVPALYLLATGRWRALGGFAAGAAALVGLSVALTGADVVFVGYPAFLIESLQWQEEFGVNRIDMFGWRSFLIRTLPASGEAVRLALTVALSIATLAAALVVWRRRRGRDELWAPILALAASTILVSPHVHTHDLQILMLPAALLAAQRRDGVAVAAAGLLLFAIPLGMFGVNLATPALAAGLAIVAAMALRPSATAPTSDRRPGTASGQLPWPGRAAPVAAAASSRGLTPPVY